VILTPGLLMKVQSLHSLERLRELYSQIQLPTFADIIRTTLWHHREQVMDNFRANNALLKRLQGKGVKWT
jgi:hypothetical protein